MLRVFFLQFLSFIFICNGSIEFDVGSTLDESPKCGCEAELKDIRSEIQIMRYKFKRELLWMSLKYRKREHFSTGALETSRNDVLSVETPEGMCPPGFTYVPEVRNCYKSVYENLNWKLAGRRCRELHPDAHLVAITTQEENVAVKKFLQLDLLANPNNSTCYVRREWGKFFWTSLQRRDRTCKTPFVWKMSKGVQLPVDYTNWYDGEPNCAVINKEVCGNIQETWQFRWNDIRCDVPFCPLCEYDVK